MKNALTNEPTHVFAIDPGVTTGWAWCRIDTLDITTGHVDQMPFCAQAHEWLTTRTAVVIERYTITERTIKLSRQSASLEIIGAVRYFAYDQGAPFIMQLPVEAKSFLPNPQLKKLWWSTNDHERDALRHLFLYLVKTGDKRITDQLL